MRPILFGQDFKYSSFDLISYTSHLVSNCTGPEPVRNLSFEVVSEGVVSITWIKPALIGARAQILHYEITYGPFGGHNTTLISVKESVTLRNLGEFIIKDVLSTNATIYVIALIIADGKIPYSVVVKAQTNESLGERATIVVFSSEGGMCLHG